MSNKIFQKSKVLTISFAHFAHDVFSSFLAPLLPLLIAKLEISLFMAAILDTANRIPALLNPFFGLIAEKKGAKYFVILTPAVTAISTSLIGLAPSFTILFILLFVAGISSALFHVPSPTMIKISSGNKVGKGMSYFMVGGELARTVGPLVATAAVSWWGLEGLFKIIPLGILASFILYFKLKDFKLTTPLSKPREKGDTKKLLKKYSAFLTLLGLFILFQRALKTVLTLYLPVYLVQQGESLWFAGISLSILQFFGVIGALGAGHISDKIGRKNTLVISSIGSVIAAGFFVYFNSIFILPFIGLFVLSTGPVLMATVQDTNSHMPTFMNSMYMSINFGVSSIIVFCVGILGDKVGLELTYIISTILAIGCIPVSYLIFKYLK